MRLSRKIIFLVVVASLILAFAGCSGTSAEGEYIIEANSVSALLANENTVLVDMQNPEDYLKSHVKEAVNITRGDIVINEPVANMLAPKETIEQVMGNNGIGNDTMVIVYDNTSNMDAARIWWTLMVYGHENVKVVSGGLQALQKAGLEFTAEKTAITPVKFTAAEKNKNMIASIDDVQRQVNVPKDDIVLLDTRTQEEFDQGTIPGSVLFDYAENNNADGTYKSVNAIRMQYNDLNIKPEETVIMYCKTSVRGAETYLALYNAGYRNLKLFDSAWLGWTSNSSRPIQTLTGNDVEANEADAS